MPLIEFGTSGAPMQGEERSGDVHLIQTFSGGVLVGVIDALGHGPEAANAAATAVEALRKRAAQPLLYLLQSGTEALRWSRRVVLSLASFNLAERCMTWVGIGNVAGILIRARAPEERKQETLITRSGVLGDQLPSLLAARLPIGSGDTLIFATDGVDPSFAQDVSLRGEPQKLSDRILARYRKPDDDALVLVARYVEDSR